MFSGNINWPYFSALEKWLVKVSSIGVHLFLYFYNKHAATCYQVVL